MTSANGRKAWLRLLIPLSLFVIINIIFYFPGFVEKYYSSGIYKFLSAGLRILFGWIPISIGDILYLSAAIWFLIRAWKTLKAVFKRRVTKETFLRSLRRSIAILLWIYIIFYGFWGINYGRLGIAYQLKLEPGDYTTEDLKFLTASLISKVNSTRIGLGDSVAYPSKAEIFSMAKSAYENAEKKYYFLNYNIKSVKSSMWGWLGNYLGFLGYYNPFTGEAQVNTTVPAFVIPYTTCHEIGHQLGYGSEDEANFSGYLAAMSSTDERFHYSAYFDLFSYANHELFLRDSLAARANYKLLDTLVKKDIQEYRKFLEKHRNAIEPLINIIYGKYLQANNQPKGLNTYDEVVGWLIAYRKKYGDL
jgi:hypothetical protein